MIERRDQRNPTRLCKVIIFQFIREKYGSVVRMGFIKHTKYNMRYVQISHKLCQCVYCLCECMMYIMDFDISYIPVGHDSQRMYVMQVQMDGLCMCMHTLIPDLLVRLINHLGLLNLSALRQQTRRYMLFHLLFVRLFNSDSFIHIRIFCSSFIIFIFLHPFPVQETHMGFDNNFRFLANYFYRVLPAPAIKL